MDQYGAKFDARNLPQINIKEATSPSIKNPLSPKRKNSEAGSLHFRNNQDQMNATLDSIKQASKRLTFQKGEGFKDPFSPKVSGMGQGLAPLALQHSMSTRRNTVNTGVEELTLSKTSRFQALSPSMLYR